MKALLGVEYSSIQSNTHQMESWLQMSDTINELDEELRIEEDHRKQLLHLKDLRNRANKRNLTTEERIEVLQQIYDASLIAVQSAILSGEFKGTAAMSTVMERVRLELSEMKEFNTRASATEESNHTMTYEYELPDEDKDKEK